MPSEIDRLSIKLALVEKGLRKIFNGALKTHPELYHDWLQQSKAQEWIEDDRVLSGFGPMGEKTVGGPMTVDRTLLGDEKDFTMKTYGLRYIVEYELIEWDQYGVVKKPTAAMAKSGRDRKNILAYSILNNSLSTSDSVYQIYNGEVLCSNSHVLLRGGTGTNAPSANTGLSYLGIQTGLTDLALTENEDGLYAVLAARYLICHPEKGWEADEIVNSQYRSDNANMAKNTLSGKLRVHSNSPYLTSTTAWWLTADKNQLEMRFCVGRDLTFRRDYEISTWNTSFSMYLAARVEVLTWPGVWGTSGV